MSAFGTKRTCCDEAPMSAFGVKRTSEGIAHNHDLWVHALRKWLPGYVPTDLHLAVILDGQAGCFDVFGRPISGSRFSDRADRASSAFENDKRGNQYAATFAFVATNKVHFECDRKPHGNAGHAVRSLAEIKFVSRRLIVGRNSMRKSVVVTVVTILSMAAVATSADAKTSKSKQQYLQIKLQEATISSVRAKPASTPTSTAKTGGAMRSR
jgi:hypothetical protein